MNRLLITLLAAFLAAASYAEREECNFNFDWRFHLGDIVDGASPTLSDNSWQTVDVPHDFQIGTPWVPPTADERPDNSDGASNVRSRLSARGFKEMGIGWYRKTFTPDDSWKGRRVVVDFEGIMLVGDVWLNGQRIGGTDYGYLGFDCDITKLLRYGQANTIAVKANTMKENNSRWYTGGGLFRDVRLIITDANQYFPRNPLYITTPVAEKDKATVCIQAEMACYLKQSELKVRTIITAPDGSTILDKTQALPFNRAQKQAEHRIDSIEIASPKLWSCEEPNLYNIEVQLLRADGSVADKATDHFGIRKIEFSPEYGMRLNGKKVLLKGNANHHTLGALGAAAYPRAIEKRIQLLREWGFNHIRTSHNPYSKSLLDMCDKYGILVVDELYDKWLTQFAGGRADWLTLWQHDVPEFVRRDRNHPSVVVWSVGNELQTYWSLPFQDWGVTPYKLLRELLHRYDTTRPVTVAMHPRGRDQRTDSLPAPLALQTDIASYNYRYMYFPGDHRRFPWMIFYQSEANTAAMGPNYFEMDLGRVLGLAYWGMIDYLGESNGWPAKGWTNGIFDIALEPKPIAWFLRSFFKPDEPTVHIGIVETEANTDGLWNGIKVATGRLTDHWNRKAGSTLTLYTYTNADEVELRINGKTIGTKPNSKDPKVRNRIKWDKVPYEQGYIEAIARTAGKEVARHRIETTGEAKALRATIDNNAWKADGTDLQHIRVVATDSKGREVKTAGNMVSFKVEGPAEIVGVINGDMTSDELSVGNKRSLYDGTATVILRAKRSAGQVVVTATADGMRPAKVKTRTI